MHACLMAQYSLMHAVVLQLALNQRHFCSQFDSVCVINVVTISTASSQLCRYQPDLSLPCKSSDFCLQELMQASDLHYCMLEEFIVYFFISFVHDILLYMYLHNDITNHFYFSTILQHIVTSIIATHAVSSFDSLYSYHQSLPLFIFVSTLSFYILASYMEVMMELNILQLSSQVTLPSIPVANNNYMLHCILIVYSFVLVVAIYYVM